MTPELSTARVYTDFQGFAELRAAARNDSPEALEEVASQFEALFVQMMLKTMREASLSEGIFDSEQSEMYLGMFDQQIAIDLASRQSLGIADMMVKQLGGKHDSDFSSASDFIEYMRPLAEKAARELGVKADVLLAQSALETGWGQKIIRDKNGHSSFNLFGIKADDRWEGSKVNVSSLEYDGDIARKKVSAFRVYDSFQESYEDYVNFIQQNLRYREAVNNGEDMHGYINELQKAGYATDPHYADKVIAILERGDIG